MAEPRGNVLLRPVRNILALIVPDEPPLELQIVERTLLHAALVGLVAGLVGSAFLWTLERVQGLLMQDLSGYVPLRAAGELQYHVAEGTPFRWYFLAVLPALGGLICGYVTRKVPEARGGGGDAAIETRRRRRDGRRDRRRRHGAAAANSASATTSAPPRSAS
jgi:CIC family chloride channel protein